MSDSPPPTPPKTPKTITIGSICRDLRNGAGVSRHQLAAQTGLAETTIRRLETGRQLPTPDMVRKLLKSPALAALPMLATAAGLSVDSTDKEVGKP